MTAFSLKKSASSSLPPAPPWQNPAMAEPLVPTAPPSANLERRPTVVYLGEMMAPSHSERYTYVCAEFRPIRVEPVST
jgi:hypothetical protein